LKLYVFCSSKTYLKCKQTIQQINTKPFAEKAVTVTQTNHTEMVENAGTEG